MSNTSRQVTTMLRSSVGTQGNPGLQDPLNRPAWEWWCLPLCSAQSSLNTCHHVLDTWLDFLNIESSLIIFLYVTWYFGTCIPSEKLLPISRVNLSITTTSVLVPLWNCFPPGPFQTTPSSKPTPVCFLSLLLSLHLLEFPTHSCFYLASFTQNYDFESHSWCDVYWWLISWNLPWIPVVSPTWSQHIILWILLANSFLRP